MKRTAVILGVLTFAIWLTAQSSGQAAAQAPAAGQPAQAPTKRPPQLKTKPEQDAYNAAIAITDPAGLEKAADDFAAKFPDSEVRVLLYKNAMRMDQRANNAEKTEAMGRKVLALDPDDPEALTTVAEVIAERTHDTDIDKDQRYDEGMKMAQHALQTIDTDVSVPAGTPDDKLNAYKSGLRSQAYSTMGAIEYNRNNFAAAQTDFQKAIDAYPSEPYPLDVLRLALSIDKLATADSDRDKQRKLYGDALKVANRAVDLTQDNTQIGTTARRERDRLQQLTGAAAPTQ